MVNGGSIWFKFGLCCPVSRLLVLTASAAADGEARFLAARSGMKCDFFGTLQGVSIAWKSLGGYCVILVDFDDFQHVLGETDKIHDVLGIGYHAQVLGCCKMIDDAAARQALMQGYTDLLEIEPSWDRAIVKLMNAVEVAKSHAGEQRRLKAVEDWLRGGTQARIDSDRDTAKASADKGWLDNSALLGLALDTLRNLLVPIIGFPDLLELPDTAIGVEERQSFAKIYFSSIDQFDLVIAALRALSRLSDGRTMPIPTQWHVSELLSDLDALMWIDIRGDSIDLSTDPGHDPTVYEARELVEMILKLAILALIRSSRANDLRMIVSVLDGEPAMELRAPNFPVPLAGLDGHAALGREFSRERLMTHDAVPFPLWLAAEIARCAGISLEVNSSHEIGTTVALRYRHFA